MGPIITFVYDNKIWFGPLVALLATGLIWLIKNSGDGKKGGASTPAITNKSDVTVTNNFTMPAPIPSSTNSAAPLSPRDDQAQQFAAAALNSKERVTILFIDDDVEFKIVSMLRKAGWKRVSIIADVDRVDHEKIRAADIIFVDVHDVGKKLGFEREGLGLMKEIKRRYKDKKVIIYSGVPLHDIFTDELDYADARLRKSAEFIEFENKIEHFSV